MKELKDISLIDFEKLNGLVPAVVQDNQTQKVLMVGFMNADAVNKTLETRKVTFCKAIYAFFQVLWRCPQF